jgi:hypothetical protein
MSEETIKSLVNCQEKRQFESLTRLIQEDRERRILEEVQTKGSCVTERKTWRRRV